MDSVIKVENVSKKFRLRTLQAGGGTLRDVLANALRLGTKTKDESGETLWALRDVSFDVERGATLGIVGRNGAGKSTLLKVLSRITKPTSGRIAMRGRIGSLLEVGTGFHPELSGRENIFLNGAVLGMQRREIEKKFDEIVAFSDLEKFLETPVKHYSSGMYMRLAFAVAAHLEPEILIVDEVLAVGDVEFQKKCLGKMNEVAESGRTVLFVSHNAAALQRLCKTGIYLERGGLKNYGAMRSILAEYQTDVDAGSELNCAERFDANAVPEGEARFIEWHLIDSSTEQPNTIYSREKCRLEFMLVCKRNLPDINFRLIFQDERQNQIVVSYSQAGGMREMDLVSGIYKLYWEFDLPIKSGSYSLTAEVFSSRFGERIYDTWKAVPPLVVLPVLEFDLAEEAQGILNTPVVFEIKKEG